MIIFIISRDQYGHDGYNHPGIGGIAVKVVSLDAEPALTRGVGAERAEEVDATEGGPVGVAEVELGVGALPEQEPAEPLLARGPDDQVGIGLPGRVGALGGPGCRWTAARG